MKLKDLDLDMIKQYLRIDFEDDDLELELYLEAAKSYTKSYTGLEDEDLNQDPLITMIVLQLVAKFYEIKTVYDTGVVDKVFSDMLRISKGEWL